MKKALALFTILFGLGSAFARNSNYSKNLEIELYADSKATVDFSQMDSKFEYITLFYQDIFFNLNLLNRVNRNDLRNICLKVYENLKNGRKCQIIVKNFLDNQDLSITFGQMPSTKDSLLIMTNYDKAKNTMITDPENMKDSWGLLYYIKNGKLIYYKNIEKEHKSAQEKLEKNLDIIETNPKPIVYMMVVENYLEMNEIEKAIKYLKDNKDKAIKLSPKTTKPGNINDVILCMEEECKIFQMIK
ncbi:MAG: hypothetical protein Q4B64_06665 [Spirochaetales bacterium]|nr:hypothetical protein [Spirochaetales bacterium]